MLTQLSIPLGPIQTVLCQSSTQAAVYTKFRSTSTYSSRTFSAARPSIILRKCVRSVTCSAPGKATTPCLPDMKPMTGILDNLVFLSRTRNCAMLLIAWVISYRHVNLSTSRVSSQGCSLGADPDRIRSCRNSRSCTWAAEGLAHTCWVMYRDQPSGLGPKYAYLIAIIVMDEDPWPSDSYVFKTEAHPLPVLWAHHYWCDSGAHM
jgi:hypothetical protein